MCSPQRITRHLSLSLSLSLSLCLSVCIYPFLPSHFMLVKQTSYTHTHTHTHTHLLIHSVLPEPFVAVSTWILSIRVSPTTRRPLPSTRHLMGSSFQPAAPCAHQPTPACLMFSRTQPRHVRYQSFSLFFSSSSCFFLFLPLSNLSLPLSFFLSFSHITVFFVFISLSCLWCNPVLHCKSDHSLCAHAISLDNLAKTLPEITAKMAAKLATYTPYVPTLSPANLACYTCGQNSTAPPHLWWQDFSGPCCVKKNTTSE